jgi:alpha-tubulin suppressor-like RCC1 family protein
MAPLGAWGYGHNGQIGNSAAADFNPTPLPVTGLTGIRAIAAGAAVGYALKADGTVTGWGQGEFAQLGRASTQEINRLPLTIPGLVGIQKVASGGRTGYAIRSDGTLAAWGLGSNGELGDGHASESSPDPVTVSGLTGVTGVSGGFAVKSDGTVWAWGNGDYGRLGNGLYRSSTTPVQVSGITGATKVVGYGTAYALLGAP